MLGHLETLGTHKTTWKLQGAPGGKSGQDCHKEPLVSLEAASYPVTPASGSLLVGTHSPHQCLPSWWVHNSMLSKCKLEGLCQSSRQHLSHLLSMGTENGRCRVTVLQGTKSFRQSLLVPFPTKVWAFAPVLRCWKEGPTANNQKNKCAK